MVKAFLFGKFLPFHKGHEAILTFALTKCDFLSVLVCCSDQEIIPDHTRVKWIKDSFENTKNIEITSFNYIEDELPNSSVSSEEISLIWSDTFKKLFPEHQLLITSEVYGDFVAKFMGIKHIAFDIPKELYPVSATAIRHDLFANWKFLPNSVKLDYAMKVVILGTESTGKSTLVEMLQSHYNCSIVTEAGRDLVPNSASFSLQDLQLVAIEHANRIDLAVLGDSPLVIMDTDVHITKSYAKLTFHQELEVDKSIEISNKAKLYLYLNNDVDFVQDGTRLSKAKRDLLDISHRNVLKDKKIEIVEITGDWNERFISAINEIDLLISNQSKKNLKVRI